MYATHDHPEQASLHLLRQLGQGGMGQVWQGMWRGHEVAIKLLTAERAREPRFARLLRVEAQHQARMSHPGIVQLLDMGLVGAAGWTLPDGVFVAPDSPYLIMEYVEGTTLQAVMNTLSWQQLRRVLIELLAALAHAHAMGVVHRDLKPQNILLVGAPRLPGAVRLVDFGVAHRMEADDEQPLWEDEETLALTGTPRYMSPEQILRQRWQQGPWSDLYALGCLTWQIVCGRAPFEGELVELLEGHLEGVLPAWTPRIAVPAELVRWVTRLLMREPDARFQRAADAAWAIKQLDSAALSAAWPTATTAPVAALPAPTPPTWRLPTDAAQKPRGGLGLWGVRTLPLAGREVERDVLWALLRQSAADRVPRLALLSGETGCGKSRLAQWLLGRAHELGAATPLQSSHSAAPGAMSGIGPMLARALRADQLPPDASLVDHLLTRYEALGLAREEAIYEVLPMASLIQPGKHTLPQSRAERLQTAAQLVRMLAAERPLVLWMDDAGWDAEALELARRLLDTPELRCLILITHRDSEPPQAERTQARALLDVLRSHKQALVLALSPLEGAEEQALLRQTLGLTEQVAADVRQLVRGNPLFAIQLVGDWIARGVLVTGHEGYAPGPGAQLQLPDDLHAVWRQRVAHLLDGADEPEVARRSLELAAALGHEVTWHEWHFASRQAGVSMSAQLVDRMVELGLARRSPRSIHFIHGLLRESIARDSREAGRWAGLHAVCARMIEAMYPERHPGATMRLAEHWWEAGDREAALPVLYDAIDLAADAGDFDQVDTLLVRHAAAIAALRLPEAHPHQARHLGQRGSQHHRRGRHEEGLEDQRRAVELSRAHGWRSELALSLRRRGLAYVSMDQPRAGWPLLMEALALCEELGLIDDQIRTLAALVGACRRLLRREEAERFIAALAALEQRRGVTLPSAYSHIDMSFLLANLGELEGAMTALEEAQRRADLLHNRSLRVWCLNARGDLARLIGDHELALQAHSEALVLDRRYFPNQAPIGQLNILITHVAMARWETVREEVEEVERALRQPPAHDNLLGHVGLIHMCCGAARGALDQWARGAALVEAQSWSLPEHAHREVIELANQAAALAHRAGWHDRAALPTQIAAQQLALLTPFAHQS